MNDTLRKSSEETLMIDRLCTRGDTLFTRRNKDKVKIRLIAQLNAAQLALSENAKRCTVSRFAVFFDKIAVSDGNRALYDDLCKKA